jgi:hypothetical protein
LSGVAKPSPATPDKFLIVFQYHGKKKQMSGIFLNQIVHATRNSLENLESEYLFNDWDILFNEHF